MEGKDLLENGASKWDVTYLESLKNVDDLVDLIVAANFLDIEGLECLGCAKIASVIKGKNVQEIRDLFGIENDFTPEEEA